MLQVIQRNMTISHSEYYRDLITDLSILELKQTDFDFAIYVNSASGNNTLSDFYD